MKKKLILTLFLLIGLLSVAQPVDAHFLATDGNIGTVLHVDPNDDPIAGSQASFFFEFKDKENKFIPQKCDCTFEIVENGNTIYTQPLFQSNSSPDLSSASVFYTFPQRDVYQVQVIGKPTSPNAFQHFTLTWNFRVDQQQANPQDASGQNNNNFFTTHLAHFIGLGVIVFCFLIYFVYKILHKKNPSVKGGGEKHDKEDHRDIY